MLKKTLLAAVVLGLSATAVQADDVSGYLSGNVGQSDTKGGGTDTAYKIAVGLQANQYVALEAQYIDLGEGKAKAYVAVDDVTVRAKGAFDTKGFGANLVGTLPLDDFKLFGKVGYHRLETKGTVKGTATKGTQTLNFKVKDKTNEWVPSFGAGASYAFTPAIEVVAEYERYKKVADSYDVDLASVGLRYNF